MEAAGLKGRSRHRGPRRDARGARQRGAKGRSGAGMRRLAAVGTGACDSSAAVSLPRTNAGHALRSRALRSINAKPATAGWHSSTVSHPAPPHHSQG